MEPQRINKIMDSNKAEPVNSELYSDIELTEEEANRALLEAKEKKHFATKIAEYKKNINTLTEYPTLKPSELYKKVHDSGFEVDESNKQIIWNLCQYFAGNPNGPFNLRKGIMLYGPVGCYKTSLMKFFANNQSNSFVVYPVNEIAAGFTAEGHESILKYKGLIPSTDTFRTFGQQQLGICFDDFGTETDKKHYGNEANVMTEIILSRHLSHYNLIGKTHFTTNINVEVIEQRYGERVRSRLREMVNLVEFPDNSKDRRK